MNITCVGVDYRTAAVALRERLAFSDLAIQCAASQLPEAIAELVVLSTCNRVELYGAGCGASDLYRLWADLTDVPQDVIRQHGYRHEEREAVAHLARVATGLESMIVGEPQILGQVKSAVNVATRSGMVGGQLRVMTDAAVAAGKRARTETPIGRSAVSLSSVAVRAAERALGTLKGRRVLLIGAGKMGQLALKALRVHELADVVVVNRTVQKATELADQFEARAAAWNDLPTVLREVDLVISATNAPHSILAAEQLRSVRQPLVVVDLAVPRDVEPAAADLPCVTLFDVDGLQQHVNRSADERRKAVPQVEQIIEEELNRFEERRSLLAIKPVLVDLREQAEDIRERELTKALRRMPELDDGTREQIERFSESLVKKLLHMPTQKLRHEANGAQSAELVDLTRQLFGLESL